ncbi:hypothetical protein PENARI_c003G03221 [Penicillium arizonense]|uniref:Cytochrome P450 n=1 Tax=Penicillium arizonense TaxID=1835702 RepID=A0A1F5LS86_PENAI|nr:hypothetical protein PENARI_c003G03221 [Penicillium arizonense]OGE56073.1 hypothetical protein PENARI_c003G03221 [Penicillium arizonense]
MDNSTTISVQGPSKIEYSLDNINQRFAVFTIFALFLAGVYMYNARDPHGLKKIPAIHRSRFVDAFQTGVYWRFLFPRLFPYAREGYYKYSKNGKPFKIWMGLFQNWVYILPPKYLARIKNQGLSELSFRSVVDTYLVPKFSSGHFDNFEIQVASKLVNGNLSDIKPLIQVRTEHILDKEIGNPQVWKRLHAHTLAMQIMKYASGRVVFGETLCENEAFLQAMERYSTKVMYYGLILRWINLGRLRDYIMYMVHWKHRRDLAIATRYVTEHIEERKRANANLSEEEKPVDCIQWAMDQPLPDEQKTPEQIAHRLLHLSAGLIGTPATVLVNLLFDTVSHKEYLPELRAEITKCVSEDGRWTESAMAKMKKFDSFIQECFRITPGIVSLTGWRLVTSETFRFDETLELPKGTLITFPTMFMQHDSDLYPEAEKFDGYRFYRMREEAKKLETASNITDTRNDWLAFGHGRQACPGRFYAIKLLKTILGELITRYDIRYAGGERERPKTLDLEPVIAPDLSVELEFRSVNARST